MFKNNKENPTDVHFIDGTIVISRRNLTPWYVVFVALLFVSGAIHILSNCGRRQTKRVHGVNLRAKSRCLKSVPSGLV